jgi:WD40 repeat protein
VNWKSGDLFGRLIGHHADVNGLVKLVDANDQIASGSCDLTIKIWHWPSMCLLKNLTGQKSCLLDLVSLSDQRLVICTDEDKKIKILNRSSGELLKTLVGHSNHPNRVVLLKNKQLASSSLGERTIRIWNLTSARVARVLTGHKNNISVLLSINKSTLVSAEG